MPPYFTPPPRPFRDHAHLQHSSHTSVSSGRYRIDIAEVGPPSVKILNGKLTIECATKLTFLFFANGSAEPLSRSAVAAEQGNGSFHCIVPFSISFLLDAPDRSSKTGLASLFLNDEQLSAQLQDTILGAAAEARYFVAELYRQKLLPFYTRIAETFVLSQTVASRQVGSCKSTEKCGCPRFVSVVDFARIGFACAAD